MSSEERRYTDKQQAFLDALCGEAQGNIRAAMDIAGYSRTTKSYEVVNPLKAEIIERASLMMAMNAPKATFSMIGVLDDPTAMGAKNSVMAAKEILDRAGLVKKEQVEVKTDSNAVFILPPKHDPQELADDIDYYEETADRDN